MKFKVSKQELVNLLHNSAFSISFNSANLPDSIELEGELLEGDTVGDYCEKCGHLRNCEDDMGCGCKCHGTVEKCCSKCWLDDFNKCAYPKGCCHNKKEEKPLHGHALGVSCVPDCFNRETPKEEIYQTYKGVTATVKIDYEKQSCDLQMQNAIPEVPEIIGWYDPEQADPILVSKFNELVRYLASKENK